MPAKCSLRKLAATCGYSTATVSMALRGMGRVPTRTRHAIEKAAARLGYVRDPDTARVMSRIRQPSPNRAPETLVFLSEVALGTQPDRISPWIRGMFQASREEAHLLGYELELEVVDPNVASQKRLSRILTARGIRGLLVGPITLWNPVRLHFDWNRFAAVEMGTALNWPNLHRFARESYDDLLDLYAQLKDRGYRRIGFALSPLRLEFMHHTPESTFLLFRQWHPEMKLVKPMAAFGEWNAQGLRRWLRDERPDVILIYEPDVHDWLRRAKVRMPRDLSVVHLNSNGRDQSGLIPDTTLMAKEAVGKLVRMVEGGEWGVPRRRCLHAFRNLFHAGRTIRPLPRAQSVAK